MAVSVEGRHWCVGSGGEEGKGGERGEGWMEEREE